ncbi:uncharacterized protein N7525_004998 [Penicillium rubens]|uniref:uncharacterized protein n=1 Tax=Penicillium rubens TaxID=1108849 RepID=UPI002A5B114F|nr:uncharacterized protein N7525_004998 [Penicillium rubens]KAJ5839810.1 hypothetical protein N7525_004998 [Penicillium rubens]KAJ5867803.1 hypothetical protein N7534_002356 [Penicillium rubens]
MTRDPGPTLFDAKSGLSRLKMPPVLVIKDALPLSSWPALSDLFHSKCPSTTACMVRESVLAIMEPLLKFASRAGGSDHG